MAKAYPGCIQERVWGEPQIVKTPHEGHEIKTSGFSAQRDAIYKSIDLSTTICKIQPMQNFCVNLEQTTRRVQKVAENLILLKAPLGDTYSKIAEDDRDLLQKTTHKIKGQLLAIIDKIQTIEFVELISTYEGGAITTLKMSIEKFKQEAQSLKGILETTPVEYLGEKQFIAFIEGALIELVGSADPKDDRQGFIPQANALLKEKQAELNALKTQVKALLGSST